MAEASSSQQVANSGAEKMREHALEQIMKLVKSQLSLEKNQRRLERRVRRLRAVARAQLRLHMAPGTS